jgi:hypothetical protein
VSWAESVSWAKTAEVRVKQAAEERALASQK